MPASRQSSPRGRETPPETAPYREPFRTAIVLAVCGTFVATVALLTAGAVASALLGFGGRPGTVEH